MDGTPAVSLLRSDMKTRREASAAKSRKKVSDRRNAYWLVDMRDKGCCRACGTETKSFHPNLEKRREHHHIRGRQVKDAETTGNICLLCGSCHDLRHVKRTLVITGHADQLLAFSLDGREWNG